MMDQLTLQKDCSSERCRIRDRHKGSLINDIQGVTVQTRDSEFKNGNQDFCLENVGRLHEIQSRCRAQDNNRKGQPLKATKEQSFSNGSPRSKVESLAPLQVTSEKLVKRNQSYERGSSAHSDYYSLSDDAITKREASPFRSVFTEYKPVFPSHSEEQLHRPFSSGKGKSKNDIVHLHEAERCYSSELQRPVLGTVVPLQPLPVANTFNSEDKPLGLQLNQTDVQTLKISPKLNPYMRKLRINNLMSKIKGQKPACDVDYQSLRKTVEKQHQLYLADNEAISLCSSRKSSPQNEINSQRTLSSVSAATEISRPTSSRLLTSDSLSGKALLSKRTGIELKTVQKQPGNNLKHLNKSTFFKKMPAPPLRKTGSETHSVSSVNMNKYIDFHKNDLIHSDAAEGKGSTFNKDDCKDNQLQRPHMSLSENTQYEDFLGETESSDNLVVSELDVLSNNIDADELKLNLSHESKDDITLAESGGCSEVHSCQHSICERYGENCKNYVISDDNLCQTTSSPVQNPTLQSVPNLSTSGLNELNEPTDMEGSQDTALNGLSQRASSSAMSAPKVEKRMPLVKEFKLRKNHSTLQPAKIKDKPLYTHSSRLPKSQSLGNLKNIGKPSHAYRRGELPKYLKDRKAEQQRLEEAAAAVDPNCPPGHVALPEHDRINTLHLLQKRMADVMSQLSSLPVAQDTLRVRSVRGDLEAKLIQLEEGIQIFSQPKVYVVNDD